ncbi:HAD family hydrolase [Streptomyces pseudovenezuelae]|uniref:HAD superfamily hydrolase (TIGR01493 family) n=1 Tax=Streptomyces pseudovenezuelae TaxID=67350 RepID=A0ABT6LS84_9ACTN|nr:HAD-IA family hydrolase [Streptomyces pseudovenezuelae]MDH6219195.1 HAD superfamily hydrolase (TIGR01493 family) [Streptomyces pseudovenezuelae]
MTAVLFDFSGTLFRIEPTDSWLRAVLDEAGMALPEAELAQAAKALEVAGAQPGGAQPERLPAELGELWRIRDESAELHRAAYTAAARQVPLPEPELYDALYERHKVPDAWSPYPDAAEVLSTLRERDIAVGVVSNIGWDLRPVFRAHGLDPYVGAYVLSYEHGIQKPDTRLFTVACDALGVAPEDTLMVGDDRRADGGAAALGCRVHLVDHLPVERRPEGLRPVLGLVG